MSSKQQRAMGEPLMLRMYCSMLPSAISVEDKARPEQPFVVLTKHVHTFNACF